MARGKHTILVEGWRHLPHSYSVVNQHQCLEILKRPEIRLFHNDVPYFRPAWRPTDGLFDPTDEQALRAIPPLPADELPDVAYRIGYPFDFGPSRGIRTFVFCTAEYHIVPDVHVQGNCPAAQALAQQPDLTIVTPSNWSREGFLRSGVDPARVIVVPIGVNPSVLHPASAEKRQQLRRQFGLEGFVFLSLGAMTPNKGLIFLLKALAAVIERHPEARVLLKGLDELYSSMESLETIQGITAAEAAILRSHISYIGEAMSFTDVAKLYQAADCYVSSYLCEGFNMPVLEAAACGLPVICTAGGPTDDFTAPDFALRIPSSRGELQIPPRGEYVLPDQDALIAHMSAVIERAEFRASALTAGPRFVANGYHWSQVTERLLTVLLEAR